MSLSNFSLQVTKLSKNTVYTALKIFLLTVYNISRVPILVKLLIHLFVIILLGIATSGNSMLPVLYSLK